MPQAFIFDLDDTLTDRTATVEHFVKEQYKRFGLDKHYLYETYRSRFMTLDKNGYADKQEMFTALKS